MTAVTVATEVTVDVIMAVMPVVGLCQVVTVFAATGDTNPAPLPSASDGPCTPTEAWRPGDAYHWHPTPTQEPYADANVATWSHTLGWLGSHPVPLELMQESMAGPAPNTAVLDAPQRPSTLPAPVVEDVLHAGAWSDITDAPMPATPPGHVWLEVRDRKNILLYNGIPVNAFLSMAFQAGPTTPGYPNMYDMARNCPDPSTPQPADSLWLGASVS